jgi:N-acetylneuraminate synthase/N,N'-diacetyllegionaminate synthase
VIEKHITLDRKLTGPDHFFALEPEMFSRYVAQVREAEAMLGDGSLGPQPIEREVGQVARRGVVAGRSIPAGTVLSEAMLACKRPAGPIEPHQLPELVGRRTRRDVAPDEPIEWDMIE